MKPRELKNYTFQWRDEFKNIVIGVNRSENDFITLDKVRMIALMRYIVRVLDHLSTHHRIKK